MTQQEEAAVKRVRAAACKTLVHSDEPPFRLVRAAEVHHSSFNATQMFTTPLTDLTPY